MSDPWIPVEVRFKQAVAENPQITTSTLARWLGISREQVVDLCKEHNINLKRPLPFERRINRETQYGYGRHSPSVRGEAGELSVCADLLRRGVSVYKAVCRAGAVDLVGDVDGHLLRFEVRTGTKRVDGKGWSYQTPADNTAYDVLALVTSDCSDIAYKPPIFGDDPPE